MKKLLRILTLALTLALPSMAAAQAGPTLSGLRDPGIPPGELLVYRERNGQEQSNTQVLTTRVDRDGVPHYRIRTTAKDRELEILVDRGRMLATESIVVRKTPETTTRTVSQLVQTSIRPTPGEILINDFNGVVDVMRGLDFAAFKVVKLRFPTSQSFGGIELEFRNNGKEKVTVPAGTFEAWQIQIGVRGVLSALAGKNLVWFDAEAPHRMVKSQGPSAGPGSPDRTMELLEVRTQP